MVSPECTPQLKRSLGLLALTAFGVGDILGIGVYGLIGRVAGTVGNAAWLSYVLAGITAGLTGLTYAELAEGMPFRNLNDGVTPVVIGGNDWAAAWATDDYGVALVPIGRGAAGEQQREIAYRFGFSDQAQFSRLFKAMFGKTPTDWRRETRP